MNEGWDAEVDARLHSWAKTGDPLGRMCRAAIARYERAETTLQKVIEAAESFARDLDQGSTRQLAQELRNRLAAAQPEEPKPIFGAGVTLDAAGKRLQVALGHIADGTPGAAAQPKEEQARERARELRGRVVASVAGYFNRWTCVADEAVPPMDEFLKLLPSVCLEISKEALWAENERLRSDLEIEEMHNSVIEDLVKQRDQAEAEVERLRTDTLVPTLKRRLLDLHAEVERFRQLEVWISENPQQWIMRKDVRAVISAAAQPEEESHD